MMDRTRCSSKFLSLCYIIKLKTRIITDLGIFLHKDFEQEIILIVGKRRWVNRKSWYLLIGYFKNRSRCYTSIEDDNKYDSLCKVWIRYVCKFCTVNFVKNIVCES